MNNRNWKIVSIIAFLFVSLTASAIKDKEVEKVVKANVEKIKAGGTEDDKAQLLSLLHETVKLAEENEQYDEVMDCYASIIVYLTYIESIEMAISELHDMRSFVERTGANSTKLYNAWQNIVLIYFNTHDMLHAVDQFYDLQRYAAKMNDYFGLSLAYTAMGIITSYSYEDAYSNISIALENLKKCDDRSNEYYNYYILAHSAMAEKLYDKALMHVDQMLACEDKPPFVSVYANYLRMYVYLGTKKATEATHMYKLMCDDMNRRDFMNDYYIATIAPMMCEYVCKYGNPEDISKWIGYLQEPIELATAKRFYYLAKRDYVSAYKWLEKIDSIKTETDDERSRSELLNAQVYYKSLQLKEDNQQRMIDEITLRSTWLKVLVGIMFVGLAVVIGMFLFSRSHLIQLRKKHAKVRKLSALKTDLFKVLSHKAQLSIGGIMDQINNPANGFSEDEKNEMLGYLDSQNDKLTALLQNVVIVNRMSETPTANALAEYVGIKDVCKSVIDIVKPKLSPTVEFDAEGVLNSELTLKSDRKLLSIALTSVVDTVAKITKTGKIKIELLDQYDSSDIFAKELNTMSVKSTQIAISNVSKSSEQIYEKIGRMDSNTELGLSIARQALGCIGGGVKLDSSFMSGTRYIITLK